MSDADPSVETDKELGVRTARFGRVAGGEAIVEVPDGRAAGATISVTGEALDDQPGRITVQVDAGVSVELALSIDEARGLAETIDRAADEAGVKI